MQASVLSVLRAATAEAHARLESRLDVMEAVSSLVGRRSLVERFYGLYAAADPVLLRWLVEIPGLNYAGRRRVATLRGDLEALGSATPEALPVAPAPVPASAAEALGVLYVLEGSTLGGRIIRRRLAAQGQDARGLSFLDPYGSHAGQQWRSLVAVLERDASPPGAKADACVQGALACFALAEKWLCAPAPAAI